MYALRSLQVGLPRAIATAAHPPWETGLFKELKVGPVFLDRLNLVGDGQADLIHHGGPDKAICVYPFEHYARWSRRLSLALPPAAFGENFTTMGLEEGETCLGDIWRVGEARVQVSQPRSPCYKIARRWHPSMPLWFQESGLTGWYLRVLEPGWVQAGQAITREARPHPEWPLTRVNQLRYAAPPRVDPAQLRALIACPALSQGWRERFEKQLRGEASESEEARLEGR